MINTNPESINKKLASRLKASFDGDPWHGKSLKAILSLHEGELSDKALELLLHMIAWRKYVTDILNGAEYTIELNTPEDWPAVTKSTSEIKIALDTSQETLLAAINEFDAPLWHELSRSGKYTYLQICEGVIDHDIYHSGQLVFHLRD